MSDASGLLPAAFTVEFWLRFDGADYDLKDPSTFVPHRLVAARSAGGGDWYAAIDYAEEGVTCALFEPGPPQLSLIARHSLPTPPGSYHHVACVLREDGIGMWYDGEFAMFQNAPTSSRSPAPVVFEHDGLPIVIGQGDGASPRPPEPLVHFAGALDEVRFSNGALYDPHFDPDDGVGPDSFTPETKASVLDTTTALFHFDECSGSTAVNSGPAGGDATLEDGATWAR